MFFKELLNIWREKSTLDEIVNKFIAMLMDAQWMFSTALNVLKGEIDPESVRDELYKRDRAINKQERTVRRMLVSHLALRPGMDVPACLVLMNVIKDAERVGDFCKNLFEIKSLTGESLGKENHEEDFLNLAKEVNTIFTNIDDAFADSDEGLARKIILQNIEIKEKCDAMLKELIKEELPTSKAIAYTLLARHLKRISGHLSNIATTVVSPLDMIDFPGALVRNPDENDTEA